MHVYMVTTPAYLIREGMDAHNHEHLAVHVRARDVGRAVARAVELFREFLGDHAREETIWRKWKFKVEIEYTHPRDDMNKVRWHLGDTKDDVT